VTRHAGSYAREIKAGTAAASPNGFLAWGVIVRTTTGPPGISQANFHRFSSCHYPITDVIHLFNDICNP